ncbi:MAG: hypothetical protein ABW321_24860 [Polyangiales bacterium]
MASLPPSASKRARRTSRVQLGLLVVCALACYAAVWLPSGSGLREVRAAQAVARTLPPMAAEPVVVAPARSRAVTRSPLQTPPLLAAEEAVAVHDDVAPELRIHRAREQLLVACMQGRGFVYLPRDYELGSSEEDPNRAPLAAMTLLQRQAFEDALKGGEVDATGRRKPEVVSMALPDGSRAVWDRSSCRAQAERELYGDDLTHQQALWAEESREQAAEQRARSDAEFEQSYALFSGCMHATLGLGPGADDTTEDWAENQQLTAAADAACREESELDLHWNAALERARAALADSAAATERAELERLEARALLRADTLLETTKP